MVLSRLRYFLTQDALLWLRPVLIVSVLLASAGVAHVTSQSQLTYGFVLLLGVTVAHCPRSTTTSPGVNGGSFTLQLQDSEIQQIPVSGVGTFSLAFTGYPNIETSPLNTATLSAGAIQSALNTMLQTPGSLGYVNAATFGRSSPVMP